MNQRRLHKPFRCRSKVISFDKIFIDRCLEKTSPKCSFRYAIGLTTSIQNVTTETSSIVQLGPLIARSFFFLSFIYFP